MLGRRVVLAATPAPYGLAYREGRAIGKEVMGAARAASSILRSPPFTSMMSQRTDRRRFGEGEDRGVRRRVRSRAVFERAGKFCGLAAGLNGQIMRQHLGLPH
jgi:hypothetical protein